MQPGATLSLIRQQHMTDLALKLTPQAVITGRILDAEGEPVENAQVALEGYRYINGRKQLMSSFIGGGRTTNDLGEYRLFGVARGSTTSARRPCSQDRWLLATARIRWA